MKPVLIVPVETLVREFDPKLLFASIAAESGFRVFFGSQTEIHRNIDRLPRGIYLTKDVRSSKLRIFSIMRDFGHVVAGWDEEGLVRYTSDHYFKLRVADEALDYVKLWFAWGDEDAEVIRSHRLYNDRFPIVVAGNPRVDMLREPLRGYYTDEAAKLQSEHGKFVLINTNFGHSNHFLSGQTISAEQLKEELGEKPEADWHHNLAVYRDAMFAAFQSMIPQLAAALPDTTIVVRPHPSEGHDVWQAAAQGHANVKVIHHGSALPWILASEVLIHNGCTTAVEANLLGKPAITYRPYTSEIFDRELPDSLSMPAFDIGQLIEAVRPFTGGSNSGTGMDPHQDILDHHVTATVADTLCSDLIVQHLAQFAASDAAFPVVRPLAQLRAKALSRARAAEKWVNSHIKGSKNWHVYERHRFPDIDLAEVKRRNLVLGKLTGRFANVDVRQQFEYVYEVSSTD